MDYRDVEQLLARERGVRARLRGLPRPARLALAAALLVAFAAFVLALSPRKDLAFYPPARLVLGVAGFAVLALLAVWHALRPLYRPALPAWVSILLFGAGVGALGVWAALPELPTVGVSEPRAPGLMRHCLLYGTIAGGLLALLVGLLDRGGRTGLDRAAYGAVFGGLAANVGLVLFCPINAPMHLLCGHAAVPLALIGLGAIGMLAIRRRRATPPPRGPETSAPP